jgi:hypothetical protein
MPTNPLDNIVEDQNSCVNAETEEFIKLAIESLSNLPTITGGKVSSIDIQEYIAKCLPILMKTKEGQLKIVSDIRKINSIAFIRKEALDTIIAENGDYKTLDLKQLLEKRTGSQVNKIVREFKANIETSRMITC